MKFISLLFISIILSLSQSYASQLPNYQINKLKIAGHGEGHSCKKASDCGGSCQGDEWNCINGKCKCEG